LTEAKLKRGIIMKKAYTFTKSKQMWAEALGCIAGGSTGMRRPHFDECPIFFKRAKGCRMWDVDDNEFIDLYCSIGPITLGYAYDTVDDAVIEVIKSSFQSDMNHPVSIDLAHLLCELIPCAELVKYAKTGTEATMAAVRVPRIVTGRRYIARHGYHGWSDMWMAGDVKSNGVLDASHEYVLEFDGTAEGLELLIKKSGKQFASVILCPADTKPFTHENFQGIIDVAHGHGALVIFDEVKTGFRCALGGAQEVLGVVPDLTTLSKGMANGYPMAAVVGKREYMELMAQTPNSGTFANEALSMTASLVTLKEFKEKDVPGHMAKMGQRLIDGLNNIVTDHKMDGPIAYGDPVSAMPRFTWEEGKVLFDNPVQNYFFSQCYRYGLFFHPWHVAFVNYSHTEKDIDQALEICDFAMEKTKRFQSSNGGQ
jgi:glutamate-1-semialdehyde 2,1-aminomutase